MTLRTRLAAIAGVVIVCGGLIIGATTARVVRDDSMAAVSSILLDALEYVAADPGRDTSRIVQFADTSPTPLSATLFFDDDEPISLVDGMDGRIAVRIPDLSPEQIDSTLDRARGFPGSILVRSLKVGEGEWLSVASSTRDIEVRFRESLYRSLAISLAIALFLVALVWWLIRRTLRPVVALTDDASRIAAGNLDVALPVAKGRDEIGQLTRALSSMVASLRDALTVTARSEAGMREFLGDASHELRTPLTVIRGYIDILDSGKELSPDQRERAMRRLVGESQRMSQTIDDLLLLSELGELTHAHDESVDLGRIIDDHVHDVMVTQPGRRVLLSRAGESIVKGDAAHLARLASNIFGNIMRHTPPDAEVRVEVVSNSDRMVVTVDDAGPGLSAEMYRRSTEGFQRFDKGRSPEGGGFGLGLSIISSVVNEHGGTLEMSPSPLGGLRTRIDLPRQADGGDPRHHDERG